MKHVLLCLVFLMAVHSAASAGFFERSVEVADLEQLSDSGLLTLKDTEFGVFLANVDLARSRASEHQAEEEFRSAQSDLDIMKLNLKAAKAEHKAAEAAQDAERMSKARKTIENTKESTKVFELLVAWKERLLNARKAGAKKMKLAVKLAETKRDLARLNLLAAEKLPSAQKYSLADFKNKLKNLQEDHQKVVDKEKRLFLEAQQLGEEYGRKKDPKPTE